LGEHTTSGAVVLWRNGGGHSQRDTDCLIVIRLGGAKRQKKHI